MYVLNLFFNYSDTGKKLNGQLGSAMRFVKKDKRYEVRMEDGQTFALKSANLTPLPHKLGASNKYLAKYVASGEFTYVTWPCVEVFRIRYIA